MTARNQWIALLCCAVLVIAALATSPGSTLLWSLAPLILLVFELLAFAATLPSTGEATVPRLLCFPRIPARAPPAA